MTSYKTCKVTKFIAKLQQWSVLKSTHPCPIYKNKIGLLMIGCFEHMPYQYAYQCVGDCIGSIGSMYTKR